MQKEDSLMNYVKDRESFFEQAGLIRRSRFKNESKGLNLLEESNESNKSKESKE